MNENLDLCEILKDAPEGTELWTPIFGKVHFKRIDKTNEMKYPISVLIEDDTLAFFMKSGKYCNFANSDIMLFPSKDQRDWSLFRVVKNKQKVILVPFARVLVRDDDEDVWTASLLSDISEDEDYPYITVSNTAYEQCIPYNEDTAPLLGTDADCPIDYEITFDRSYAPRI